jgi:hypothetical protein
MTRRFDIGPLLVALGALVLLVALFLDWYGGASAWDVFEITDLLLAGLAIASLVIAAGVVVPELGLAERRWLPWLVGAALVVTAVELLNPPPAAVELDLGTGAWLAFAAACLMAVGTVLTLGRVSLAVAVEARDARRRVAAVDERPPATEAGAPVTPSAERPSASSAPLLRPRERAAEEPAPPREE